MARIVDYYHRNVCLGVALRVAERLLTCNIRKSKNFKKISEMLGFDGKYPAGHRKNKFCLLC